MEAQAIKSCQSSEFPDLCVLLLLIFVTWPIYLLQKHQVKVNPGNLKSNESLLNPFLKFIT